MPDGVSSSKPSMADKIAALYGQHGEKLRYFVVGVWNTGISYLGFFLAITFLADPLQAVTGLGFTVVALVLQWAVWSVMVLNSIVMMKYFAFRSKGHLGNQILRGYLVYLPAQGLSFVILWLLMYVFGSTPLVAKVGQAVATAVAVVLGYLGHKYFTFRVPLELGEVPPKEMIEGSVGTN